MIVLELTSTLIDFQKRILYEIANIFARTNPPVFERLEEFRVICFEKEFEAPFLLIAIAKGLGNYFDWQIGRGFLRGLSNQVHNARESQLRLLHDAGATLKFLSALRVFLVNLVG